MEPPHLFHSSEGVLNYLDALRDNPASSDEDLHTLLAQKHNDLNAQLLIRFVPIAFAFAFIKHMGVKKFPLVFKAQKADKTWQNLLLEHEPIFNVALRLGLNVVEKGYIPRLDQALFEAVLSRSAEMEVVNKALSDGMPIEQLQASEINAPALLGVDADLLLNRYGLVLDENNTKQ